MNHLCGFAFARRSKRLAGTDCEVDRAIAEFLEATERHGAAKGAAKKKLEGQLKKMRLKWKEWQGEDSLYEMAFGEPIE